MNSKYVIHFSRSGQITLVDPSRKLMGVGISFLLHIAGVWCIISASSALTNFTPPMVIDFSIEQFDGGLAAKKPVAKVVRQQKPPVQRIKQVPPPSKPLPEKAKVVIPKKVEPIVTKKVVVEEKVPEQNVVEHVPEPPLEEQVIQEDIPVQDVASEVLATDDLEKATGPVVVKSAVPPKEKYVKEHFLYIKESVQNKISYPRIARKMGWQGRVLISFVICRDGSVRDIKIVESSGFKALDKNAVEAIRKEAPFPKPPVSAELIIPVTYKLG